ncbi:MAG: hypothetical protein Q4E38_04665 [Eubacteriales bacterium]|nr:hypothetical protein [Eubacteriales bacterium]
MEEKETLQYSIWDPTGNITALVESTVAVEEQPTAAAALMQRHPEVEQVGFLRFPDRADHSGVQAELRMAGGEFCGNASMSAAALCLLRQGAPGGTETMPELVRIRVSGVEEPVTVRLRREGLNSFRARVHMPTPQSIGERVFAFEGVSGRLPLVCLEGISHLLVGPDTAFAPLLRDRPAAERAVRAWCAELKADGLGLMFLSDEEGTWHLTPLVYVPGSGTVFWENSCASGSAAVGMALAARAGKPVQLELREPGGWLQVESAPNGGATWLGGRTRRTARF